MLREVIAEIYPRNTADNTSISVDFVTEDRSGDKTTAMSRHGGLHGGNIGVERLTEQPISMYST
jgi:hypothetical protein